ncbi:MAG TPA: DUF4157 domain-containing protein, partial [Anaerolineales bacterium]|nr:DUF4157 domain-containing protein [Anaerolineales bacterium]
MLRSRGLPPIQPKSTSGIKLQRKANDGTPPPEPTSEETTTPALIVDDEVATLEPGQMRKSEFLAELQTEVCKTAEAAMTETGRTTDGCPYLGYWFNFYSQKDSQYIERSIHKYAPETANARTAGEYIRLGVERVHQGVERWARTGEITSVPEDLRGAFAGARPVSETNAGTDTALAGNNDRKPSTPGGVHFKGRAGSARESSDPRAIQAQLDPGQSLNGGVKSRMETAFGTSFSNVRLHTDPEAAKLSRDLNARAFTVGNDIAFGSGEYQPGAPVGDALIAHELAHVVQQVGPRSSTAPMRKGEGVYNTLEEYADRSAVGAMVSLWQGKRGLTNIVQNAMPRLRSGLRLQSCRENLSSEERQAAIYQIGGIIGQPDMFESEIMAAIDKLGDDAAKVLIHVGPFSPRADDSQLHELAGTEAGQRVMARVSKALRDGDVIARNRAKTIDRILADRKSTAQPKVSSEVQQNLDRINKAISADPRIQLYRKAKIPLKLPVELYQAQREMMGGVYYDPYMPSDPNQPGDAGRTWAKSWMSERHPTRYPLIYIQIGPLALRFTDEYIRSVLWHEFQHYQQYLAFREPSSSKSTDVTILEAESADTGQPVKPNSEIVATSIQLADDFDKLSDDEAKSTLRYLSDFMNHRDTQPSFKAKAIDQIKTAVAGNRAKQDRLLGLIGSIRSNTERENLKDLRDAIRKALVPFPTKNRKKQPAIP